MPFFPIENNLLSSFFFTVREIRSVPRSSSSYACNLPGLTLPSRRFPPSRAPRERADAVRLSNGGNDSIIFPFLSPLAPATTLRPGLLARNVPVGGPVGFPASRRQGSVTPSRTFLPSPVWLCLRLAPSKLLTSPFLASPDLMTIGTRAV